jgi:hypothetical protein
MNNIMKKLLLFFLLIGTHFAYAQDVKLTGVIRNIDGNPIPSALIVWKAGSKAKTDSTGTFQISVTLPVSLHITAVGYKDTLVAVDHLADISIILKNSVTIVARRDNDKQNSAQASGTSAIMSSMTTQMRQPNTEIQMKDDNPVKVTINMGGQGSKTLVVQRNYDFDASQGAIFPVFNPKEETQGSRYLFKDWVAGSVVNNNGEMIANTSYVYNYDKMGGALLATKDGRSAIEVNRDIVKYFSLTNGNGDTVTFANMPLIDKTHYVQVLSEGSKFGIYKVIKTKFERANYTTDGVMAQGNNYDSYTDDNSYFMIDVQTGKVQQISLKKKSIKSLFVADAPKANKFVDEHASDDIDDSYLRSLGEYMNE